MNEVTIANLVAILSGLFTFWGVTFTQSDLHGFANIIATLITLAAVAWSHFSHKKAIASAQA